jgi:DNA modification methylase
MKSSKKPENSSKTQRPDKSPQVEDLSGLKQKKETHVEIKPAKGRPMLTWVGKKPLRHAIAYPAQLVETFHAHPSPSRRGDGGEVWNDWPSGVPQTGLLFHGDNKDVLAYLLANGFRGKVKLIYIDPPFDSGADYVRKVELRGVNTGKLESEGYTLGEQVQYSDIWTNDNYLQFIYERLLLLKELVHEDGSIFVHLDHRRVHHLRCLMDEIFGQENFINEIIWQHQIMGGSQDRRFPKAHETILWYSKGNDFHIRVDDPNVRVPYGEYVRNTMKQDEDGRWYYERRRMSRKATPEEAASKAHTRTYVDDPNAGTLVTDVWTDMLSYQETPDNRQGIELYPTQKTSSLLTRLISAASAPNDIVLDCFLGSGTTAINAQKLGRRWIGADINKGAIQTTIKRLQGVIQEQSETLKSKKQTLPGMEQEEEPPVPAQLGFAVYRVNDYDLQIQHNEAFNLAVEHLGMTRTKTDTFFDGTLGKKLVKIVPFNHPITPLDLEEIKNELKNRPDENRDVAVVGLGKEYAVEAWMEEWNKFRKQKDMPNKIEVIELRSDPKYGGFFTHEPAKAKVSFKRMKDSLEITIDDFISPTILERLKQQNKDNPLFQPQVSDWRSMVDSVMLDTDYDVEVFNITLADVPERKNDLVEGKYVVKAKKSATVAVKVTDMLGEEVLVVREV